MPDTLRIGIAPARARGKIIADGGSEGEAKENPAKSSNGKKLCI